MPSCSSKPDGTRRLRTRSWLFLAMTMVLAGCQGDSPGGSVELNNLQFSWDTGRLDLVLDQKLTLSEEANRALRNGVPLNFETQIILRDAAARTRVAEDSITWEIRYLPLSDRFQLDHGKDLQTWPRLRHLLARLAQSEHSLEVGPLPSGDYELLARTKLDKRSMPRPMQLPALFSPAWRHDSEWAAWPIRVESKS